MLSQVTCLFKQTLVTLSIKFGLLGLVLKLALRCRVQNPTETEKDGLKFQ